jgi:hypothetical protein
MNTALHIGFIPLIDAAALLVAVDKGFTKAEGLDVTLAREVSWSNVRDKLNIGPFDAAHLMAPIAIASSLGFGHVKVPLVASFNLGLNGNAITVSPALHAAILREVEGDPFDPMVTALALARVVAARRRSGAEPLTFGMTFPFSTHNYQLRFWIAAAGVDPEEDVRLVVLPPPYMVDSLAKRQVDAFCVADPWNSIAVDLGVGHILNFVSDILPRAVEKVLAVRQSWAERNPQCWPPWSGPPFTPRISSSSPRTARKSQPSWRVRSAWACLRKSSSAHWPAGSRSHRMARSTKTKIICWWAATAQRGPIRRRRPGFTLKWCAGGRLRSVPRRLSSRWRSSVPVFTTRHWDDRPSMPDRPCQITGLANWGWSMHSPGRASIPVTWGDTWRLSVFSPGNIAD